MLLTERIFLYRRTKTTMYIQFSGRWIGLDFYFVGCGMEMSMVLNNYCELNMKDRSGFVLYLRKGMLALERVL